MHIFISVKNYLYMYLVSYLYSPLLNMTSFLALLDPLPRWWGEGEVGRRRRTSGRRKERKRNKSNKQIIRSIQATFLTLACLIMLMKFNYNSFWNDILLCILDGFSMLNEKNKPNKERRRKKWEKEREDKSKKRKKRLFKYDRLYAVLFFT
uniref:uncharacterized protein LOC117159981 n=1 Tax=Bombus vancouverensis nearcticus TaxID=2705178 RepID=UPI00143B6EDC|nr:uncharacterized protein LOC117159981 [Bombus vancouverensis nearcticus]